MINSFSSINPILLAFFSGIITFLITTLGSSVVLFFKNINKYIMDGMFSVSAGIMLSASFFSLLSPAIDMCNDLKLITWIVVFSGFFIGGIILFIGDKLLNLIDKFGKNDISKFKRSIMLLLSITLHNIPEGLVIGITYGSLLYNTGSLISAITLTIGIGIQNFPEGCAISLPLRRDGVSSFKAFLLGSLSAIVEPIFAVLGALLVIKIKTILPFILSFTAGAMIFVTIVELIPESQKNKRKGLMALLLMLGFSIMMILELLL